MCTNIEKRHLEFVRQLCKEQRGLSLLEVLISTVVLGIAMAGFLMALQTASSTSKMAQEESSLVYLASRELEALRAVNFDNVPFVLTGEPGEMKKIPNYFTDIGISTEYGGSVQVIASGDLLTPSDDFSRNYAFDGRGAEFNERWMGDTNALAYVDDDPAAGEPGGGGPGGGGPNASGPGSDPGADDPYAPDDFQYIYGAFPESVKVSRILYDNRFNVTEEILVPLGDFDRFPHSDDIWQRGFNFFWTNEPLGFGEILDPWNHEVSALKHVIEQGYGSSGIWVIYDDADNPKELAVIGVQNIDTYSDFDIGFHWPYVSEIEIYGYSDASNFVETGPSDTDSGLTQFNNVIMYFPNYLGSGFDLGRRCYVEAPTGTDPASLKSDLINVEIEFYQSSLTNNREWQRTKWWQDDNSPLARFETVFYRDIETRVDRLPNLEDFPDHIVYGDNEDLEFSFTVPGASSIRGRFGTFSLEPSLGGSIENDDHIKVKDPEDNIYTEVNGTGIPNPDHGTWPWTPWVTGDTIVIQFKSNGDLNSYDSGYGGFAIDQIEVRWEGLESSSP